MWGQARELWDLPEEMGSTSIRSWQPEKETNARQTEEKNVWQRKGKTEILCTGNAWHAQKR